MTQVFPFRKFFFYQPLSEAFTMTLRRFLKATRYGSLIVVVYQGI